jgi:hypothetical protein
MADDALLLREVLSERGEWHAGARRDAEPERRVAVR